MPAILANTITPLMFLAWWQLIFGNAIIGFVEARVVRRFLDPGRRSSVWIMIGANYFSMLIGGLFLGGLVQGLEPMLLGDVPLLHVYRVVIAIIVLNLVFSIILEWPFVYYILGADVRPGRSLGICAAAQATSYLLLLVPCWLASSVMDGVSIAPVAEISRHTNAAILFIAPDGHIHRIALDGSSPAKYRPLPPLGGADPDAVLEASLDDDGKPGLRLRQGNQRLLIDDSPGLMAQLAGYFDESMGYRRAQYLYPRDYHDWAVTINDVRYDGLDAWKGSPLGDRVHVAVSTPFLSWQARCGSVLPGDQVVFELNNHILLADLPTRRVAIVAMGRGPVVLLPPTPTPPATSPSTARAIAAAANREGEPGEPPAGSPQPRSGERL